MKRPAVELEGTTWLKRTEGRKETKSDFTQFFVSIFTVKVGGGLLVSLMMQER
jgi:hypothetical protein